ncbi:MAG TPA: hypothetical protein PKI11_11900 [Candidatus Hydrogenedentes bacterium]|nr:hypothetical protein [Candidatus Hydrogenedentota bacterium]
MPSRWAHWVQGRRGYALVVALGTLLALPTLATGFFLDDYAHLMAIDGRNPVAGPWNLYVFAPGDAAETTRLIDEGPFPWFTDPNLRVEFFRPLASATMRLDRALFGDAAWAYHLHCVLWRVALLLAVGGVVRRVLPGGLGLLTFLLFTVDEAHWFTALWWSHRHTYVAATFGFAGLLAHLHWRDTGWRPGRALALLGITLGLLSGEIALTILGYFCAYELCAGTGRPRDRMRAIAPLLLLGAVYVVGYTGSGFGARAGDCYVSPIATPLAFLAKVPERFLILAATQFFSWPAELAAFARAAVLPSAAVGAIALGLVARALRRIWPHIEPAERKGVAWLALGGLLALPPFLSPFTSGRLLLVSSLGGAAVIAVIARAAWRQRRFRSLGGAFIALHVMGAALAWLALSPGFALVNRHFEQAAENAPLDDTLIADQQVMVINPQDPVLAIYTLAMRIHKGHPEPAAWRPLSLAPHDHAITRTAANTFNLEVLDGEMLATLAESIARGADNPLTVGETLRFEVAILEKGARGPKKVAFRFRAPLEDPRYVWLAWENGLLRRFELPAVGETRILRRTLHVAALLGGA